VCSKGFKCLNKAAVIQGDGINYDVVVKILEAVRQHKRGLHQQYHNLCGPKEKR
jgi:hypothetical protein